jgi:chromosome transmission fidelity protein 1
VQTLTRIAKSIAEYVTSSSKGSADSLSVNDFLFASGLDNINMFALVSHIKQSKAVFKIAGYWRHSMQSNAVQQTILSNVPQEATTAPIHAFLSFLAALTHDDQDGRVIVDGRDKGNVFIKFVLLDASKHFGSIVKEARAVILASGTLSPLAPLLRLLPSDMVVDHMATSRNIHHYACGHVIEKDRFVTVAVGSGPGGVKFDFRATSRAAAHVVDDLGRALINMCTVAPGGMVVFFPSFAYLDTVKERWKETGMLEKLSEKKSGVVVEPRTAGEVDQVLAQYEAAVNDGRGGLMLSVVGGKLAEGINFGDALGRCVVIVGLPYPDRSDPELDQRLRYIEKMATHRCASADHTSPSYSGKEHYANLCMNAVNQCVGRVIRHRQDYAAVVLMDFRYVTEDSIRSKLSEWVKPSVVVTKGFGDAHLRLCQFYKLMKSKELIR